MSTGSPQAWFGLALAALPIASVLVQFWCGQVQGTTDLLLRHHTITLVDLAFIPFNYWAARDIDWSRGRTLFGLSLVAVAANVAAHGFWQEHHIDPGHMISADRVVLPAGWAHVAYASAQMTLVLAFLFARTAPGRRYTRATAFGAVYLIGAGVSGYVMHSAVVVTDAILVVGGLLALLVTPVFFVPPPPGHD